MSTYIGVDVGTSSTKAALIDENGNLLAAAERSYVIRTPEPGFQEIEPELWFRACIAAIEELLQGRDPDAVRAIGFTGQMHSTVFLDRAGDSIRPAILWNDARTRDLIPELRKCFAAEESTLPLSASVSTGSPAAALCWLKRSEPENFSRLRHVLIGPDYAVFRFTGHIGTDACEASTSSLYDWKRHTWSERARELLGLPEEIFPKISGSVRIVGTVLPEIAARLGIRRETAVIAGTGDNPASAYAAGCYTDNSLLVSLGTSGVVMFALPESAAPAKGKRVVFSEDGARRHLLVQGTVQTCGSAVNWWNHSILGRGLDDMAALSRSDFCEELLFFPHLNGEKTLYAAPELRGAFLGLSTETTVRQMNLAVLEGISFGLRLLTEQLLPGEERSILVTGGGGKNAAWMQVLSNILNRPVTLGENINAVYGAALMAAMGNGVAIPSGARRNDQGLSGRRITPDRDSAAYELKYQRYLRIKQALDRIETPECRKDDAN